MHRSIGGSWQRIKPLSMRLKPRTPSLLHSSTLHYKYQFFLAGLCLFNRIVGSLLLLCPHLSTLLRSYSSHFLLSLSLSPCLVGIFLKHFFYRRQLWHFMAWHSFYLLQAALCSGTGRMDNTLAATWRKPSYRNPPFQKPGGRQAAWLDVF